MNPRRTARTNGIPGTSMSALAREAIGLTDTVDEALTGLAGAKVRLGGDPLEASVTYLVVYLYTHEFSAAEMVDLVREAAAILGRRSGAGAACCDGGTSPQLCPTSRSGSTSSGSRALPRSGSGYAVRKSRGVRLSVEECRAIERAAR